MNKLLRFAPAIYFILFTVLWFLQEYDSLGVVNYPCIALFIALVAQLFTNNKTTGFLYGILFVVVSGFMLITSWISYSQTVTTASGATFYTIQFGFFGFSMLMAVLMVYYNRYYHYVAKEAKKSV
ncbi:hypothetical protein ACLI1A_06350 [Flavobacterium sp. RHBU_3]|uniref:hypothetical protein n=1 Tax=Flavobacterium sp. RHBU_3 TaxID=3391184 RepID=UPI003984D09E